MRAGRLIASVLYSLYTVYMTRAALTQSVFATLRFVFTFSAFMHLSQPRAFTDAVIQPHSHRKVCFRFYSTDYICHRIDPTGLMSTVPRELRELYYDVMPCPDLEAAGTMKHASHSTRSRMPDRTSLVDEADL